ncbi:MAG: hypothetical protein KKE20_01755 [Nanoarchaeota archaeon]|nr:hypothetical protein [Nanoarchaeota archaeon]
MADISDVFDWDGNDIPEIPGFYRMPNAEIPTRQPSKIPDGIPPPYIIEEIERKKRERDHPGEGIPLEIPEYDPNRDPSIDYNPTREPDEKEPDPIGDNIINHGRIDFT